MWQACYLLDIEGLKATAALEALLDKERLQKYRQIKNETVALQSLGAGLLLQLAVGEFLLNKKDLHDKKNLKSGENLDYKEERQEKPHEELHDEDAGDWEKQRIPMFFLDANMLHSDLAGFQMVGSVSERGLELAYRYNAYGKPYFTNVPLYFSLSHSGKKVLCACSEREIGADLQKETGQNGKKISRRFFSKEENDYLSGIADEALAKGAFHRLWTRKEAYGKLTGDGVLKVADIPLLENTENMYWQEGRFISEGGEAYYYAVCVKR